MRKELLIGIPIIAVVLIVLILVILPSLTSKEPGDNSTTIVDNGQTTSSNYSIPVPNPYENIPVVTGNITILKAVAPSYLEFGEVRPNVVIDTWIADGYVNIGQAEIGYNKDERLCLVVYNGYETPINFYFDYLDIYGERSHSDITGKDYSRAPDEAVNWFSIINSVLVEPHCVMKVPFKLVIPEKVQCPDMWEFRINVTDSVAGFMTTGHEVRIFITMR